MSDILWVKAGVVGCGGWCVFHSHCSSTSEDCNGHGRVTVACVAGAGHFMPLPITDLNPGHSGMRAKMLKM